jgi:predicted 3-demethylubiquinone-9 3-methyltransferase (glyoxalase superfamily)
MNWSITPFLMFSGEHHGQAEEAINLYISVFPDSRIVSIDRHPAGGPEPEGTVLAGHFVLNGRTFRAMDSAAPHQFNFTPSISFFVEIEDEAALDALVAKLGEGGHMLMPPENYGFSRKFAWLADRFGISWQVNWA